MRTRLALLLVAFAVAVAGTGCGPLHVHSRQARVGIFIAGAAAGAIVASSRHSHRHHHLYVRHEPVYVISSSPPIAPPPPQTEPSLSGFDPQAARSALNAIDVSDCGGPSGYGHATVTMNPDGRISKVAIDEPRTLSLDAVQCIGTRLGTARVRPFDGSLVTVGTTFRLD